VIAAEGEWKAARGLKNASDVINESSSALQLRYLQTLTSIAAEKNSTIIFPMPIDLLTACVGVKPSVTSQSMTIHHDSEAEGNCI
jgi:erythrocyte band 7 integral membrane protein